MPRIFRHHVDPGLAPEQREARIAELRARRRARTKVLARRSAFTAFGLMLLVVVVAWWLLTTLGGRDFLLAQIVARLPADATLTWQRAEGPVAGPMTLHGLHFSYHGTVFDARRVTIDPAIRPLIGKRLRLDALDIDGAALEIPESDEPFELPRWPESLPQIAVPLSLQADHIRIDGFRVTQAGEPMIEIHSLRGGLDARPGELHIEQLVVDSDRGDFRVHGDYVPRDDYATHLTASALLPAPAGRTRPRVGLAVRGDLAKMEVAVSGHVPAPLRALLTLSGKDDPRWTLNARSDALDPGLLTGSGEPGSSLAFELHADGIGGEANVRGRLSQGDPASGGLTAVLQPSKVRLENQVLEFEPLVLDVFGGRIAARGRGDFSQPEDATFKFAVNARGLAFGAAPDAANAADAAPAIGADADFGIAGSLRDWAAIGKATLRRDGQQATIDFDGRGGSEAMTLKTLHAAMPTGTLDATGVVGWAPALHWDIDAKLAGFDPGYFAPEWPGAVNGALSGTGRTRDDGGLELQVDADRLGGTLRGRRLAGDASFAMHGAATGATQSNYEGEVALTLGGSRIEASGTIADRLDIDAKFSPLRLDDLLPGATGNLRGTLSVNGMRKAPDIAVDLVGSALEYGDYTAATLSANGRLPWAGSSGALVIVAQDANLGVALDRLRIEARGTVERLQLDGHAQGVLGTLDFAASTDKRGSNWRGTLASLQLAPAEGAAWQLQSPMHYAQRGKGWTLSRSCFTSTAGGSLCASADWPRPGLTIEGSQLPLALVAPYLPEREDGRPWLLRGEIALEAHLRPAGNAWQGSLHIASDSGGLRLSERARRDVIGFENLVFDASFDTRRIEATLGAAFDGGECAEPCRQGRIDAHLVTGWDSYSPLTGEVDIATDELTWLELFSPDIVEPSGRLDGHITLAGTRAQPSIGGQAQLTGFSTELPALGIALQDGNLRLDAQPDGSARIAGSVRSAAPTSAGESGVLHIDGTLGWRGDDVPLVLQLRGDDVLVSNTRDLRAVVDPDLTVRVAAGQPLSVTGTVTVPSALIDLERLDEGVSTSPDVVVLDPVDPEQGASTPLELDLTLVMGDDVKLKGFGLDGTLDGKMRVRARPGREMTASGRLEVGGQYSAYGQELKITRGYLSWSNGPVSDPMLDIRAQRRIESENLTAGISVTGRASAPQAQVWTEPPSDDAQALSYLAFGRATSNLSGDESSQLNAATAALNAGGSLLAGQIGSRIGLDDAGVIESRALGGSVLGIGKQLSPRLYVSFGVSLLGTGQVLTLKYLLDHGFDIEIESSSIENRGSINWRKEK